MWLWSYLKFSVSLGAVGMCGIICELVGNEARQPKLTFFLNFGPLIRPLFFLQASVSHDRGSSARHVWDVRLLPGWTYVHIWWL